MTGAAVLGVHLMTLDRGFVRVDALTRDANRATAFIPDEAYLQDDDRPVSRWDGLLPAIQSRAKLGWPLGSTRSASTDMGGSAVGL